MYCLRLVRDVVMQLAMMEEEGLGEGENIYIHAPYLEHFSFFVTGGKFEAGRGKMRSDAV
jgi:hypothetical protein